MSGVFADLREAGQSIWLDYIRRSFIEGGELGRLVAEGLAGVTSNPTIFEKAIGGSTDYDEALRARLDVEPRARPETLYEALSVEDIRLAADVLRPVYDAADGGDGFVSLEVSPQLARDTEGTLAEARRLWRELARPNLMIKVPATPEGIPAVEALIAEGINVNVTLIFSLAHYDAVAQAYIRGVARTPDPGGVASVASFFVSRVDTAVDRALEAAGTPEALALRGTIAVANARVAYQRYRELFHSEPFAPLRRRGARPQRPLWASTATKNPAYSDVLYVEELVGPETVNTLPPATLDALRDHGRVRPAAVVDGWEEARRRLEQLEALGVDLAAITDELQAAGVEAFAASMDGLLATLEEKRTAMLGGRAAGQRLLLTGHETRVEGRLQDWQQAGFCRRLWAKDPTLWAAGPAPELTDRLGWLTLPEVMPEQLDGLAAFATEVRAAGIRHVVLLGMGGSSLAPEVFGRVYGSAPGSPALIVLDSTHPAAVRAVAERIDPKETLFLVSSKSGTTTETLSIFKYFWHRTGRAVPAAGPHFAAITDPGTPLVALAAERGFRRTFLAPPDVGGRYSALSVFGLVPAVLIGVDVHRLLDRAWRMAEAAAFCVPPPESPALRLGAALGELAAAGRDKVTFFATPSLEGLPAWIEQLIAESTGKDGTGIVPVVDEAPGSPDAYGGDRFVVYLRLAGDEAPDRDALVEALEAAGHPVARIDLAERADLGGEYFRWEVAVAASGAVLGIHPFNQPDVQLAKALAHRAMEAEEARPRGEGRPRGRRRRVKGEASAARRDVLRRALDGWLAGVRPGDYVGIQAYLAPTDELTAALQGIRGLLRDRLRVATTLGFGPRFLHSTGQLHKGGPDSGLFLQLVDEPAEDLPVPESEYTFGALIRAQALGDFQALQQRGRRVLRLHLGRTPAAALRRIAGVLNG